MCQKRRADETPFIGYNQMERNLIGGVTGTRACPWGWMWRLDFRGCPPPHHPTTTDGILGFPLSPPPQGAKAQGRVIRPQEIAAADLDGDVLLRQVVPRPLHRGGVPLPRPAEAALPCEGATACASVSTGMVAPGRSPRGCCIPFRTPVKGVG